ncbi:aspartyl/glutamyl-tRNA(Asn/Gln) amidotransferase, C subunit [Necator americanus]|uniref:Glutamyl-tRNA(Gln) amidotransferase subunit C, mitochondrial n=1 Tax=Necator americanus TaxID=51031 RepID=W2SQ31_NECAM|nr:aspartyl/glutamyl-tRNA(Asn/Gln) amidotransferase, C subunit [Necator americanus]ETN71814.1 aspartyl/glutamyl-tRNA(Asn/Gln) amidotransferase, C subunit [Necator americanus]
MNTSRRCLFKLGSCYITRCNKKVPYPGDLPIVPVKHDNSSVEEPRSEQVPTFSQELVSHLESLSLVRFDNEQAVVHLRSAVKSAMSLQEVETTDIDPMYTVWEDQQCPLREDEVEKPFSLSQVLSNANPVQDNYFTAPPGNVPLEEAAPLDHALISQWDRLGIEVAPVPKKQKCESDQENGT